MHPAERGSGQRHTMRDGERRDGDEETPAALHQQDQRQDEEKMIESRKDVLDPKGRVIIHVVPKKEAAG